MVVVVVVVMCGVASAAAAVVGVVVVVREGEGEGGVRVEVGVQQKRDHADEGGVGEDRQAKAGLLADINAALRDLVARGQDRRDADPRRQQQRAWVSASVAQLRRPPQPHHPRRAVRRHARQREEPHDRRLWRVVDQPPRH